MIAGEREITFSNVDIEKPASDEEEEENRFKKRKNDEMDTLI